MIVTTGGITLFPHARLPIKGTSVTELPKLNKNWNVTFQVWHQTQPRMYQTPKYKLHDVSSSGLFERNSNGENKSS